MALLHHGCCQTSPPLSPYFFYVPKKKSSDLETKIIHVLKLTRPPKYPKSWFVNYLKCTKYPTFFKSPNAPKPKNCQNFTESIKYSKI